MTRSVIRGRFRRRRTARPHARAFRDWRHPVRDDARLRDELTKALSGVDLLGEPRWPAARAGDASAAIGIAVDLLWSAPVDDRRRDLVMTALWLCASRDQAALLVLEMLRIRIELRKSA